MSQNKNTIYATGNENLKGEFNVSYYIIEKDDNFLDWLEKLVNEILKDNDNFIDVKKIVKTIDDEEGNFLREEIYFKEIQKMIDVHEHYESKGDRIDLFYGKNRVYLTFRKSKEKRKKFAEFLIKTKDFIKIEESSKFLEYVKIKTQ